MLSTLSTISGGLANKGGHLLLKAFLTQIDILQCEFGNVDLGYKLMNAQLLNVQLKPEVVNQLFEEYNLPFEYVSAHIGTANISFPFQTMFVDPTILEIEDITLTVKPRKTPMDNLFASMTSSMRLTEELIKKDKEMFIPPENMRAPMEGQQVIQGSIQDLLNRLQIKCKNLVIRLIDDSNENDPTKIALEIHIENLKYFNEQALETLCKKMNDSKESNEATNSRSSTNENTATKESIKSLKIICEGIKLYTDEYSKNLDGNLQNDENYAKSESENSPTQDESLQPENSSDDESNHQVNYSNVSNVSDPIHCVTLPGRHDFRIRLKEEKDVPTPKVDLEFNLNSILYFLTPRQLNTIKSVFKAYLNTSDDGSLNLNVNGRDIDLDSKNFNHYVPNSGGLQSAQGWSTAALDDSDDDAKQSLAESFLSEMESSYSSSVSSASSSSPSGLLSPNNRQKSNPKEKDRCNQKSDSNNFRVNITSIAGILLHEEVLTPCVEGPIARSSIKELKKKAFNFFQKVDFFSLNGYGQKEFAKTKALFSKACQDNHIRILAAPVTLEGEWGESSCLKLKATASRMEIIEGLFDKTTTTSPNTPRTPCLNEEHVKLLTFSSANSDGSHLYSSAPDLKLELKFSEKTKLHSGKRYQRKHTDITVDLQPCFSEVDITMMDRLQELFNPDNKNSKLTNSNLENPCGNKIQPETKLDMKINCPNLKINLRIPNVDLRPIHDRTPWWQRMVHKDYFILNMTDATILHSSSSRSSNFTCPLEVTSREVQGFFHHGDTACTYNLLNAKAEESLDGSTLNLPRFTMKNFPRGNKSNGLDSMSGSVKHSSYHPRKWPNRSTDPVNSIYIEHMSRQKQPTPFSKKKIVHDGDTSQQNNSMSMGEEVIIPANKKEMAQFIDQTTENCLLLLEINLPNLAIVMPSNNILELIYNRINNDLLLWEPSAPKTNVEQELDESVYGSETMFRCSTSTSTLNHLSFDQQSMDNLLFDENLQSKTNGSNKESDDENETFYSIYSSNQSPMMHSSAIHKPRKKKNGQNKVVVGLTVGKGIISMYTRSMDSTNNPIPGQQGELRFLLENGSFHSVGGYKGRAGHAYFCLQVQQVSLYHNGLMNRSDIRNPKRLLEDLLTKGVAGSLGNNMDPIITRSDEGAYVKTQESSYDMLTLAVRAVPDKKTNRKTFRVAIALNNATHLYQMRRPERSWLSQLLDLFDLVDYPIKGYEPPQTQTEFYFHLWDCVIDYRPLYIPYKTALTVGSLSISSNIVPQTSTSTLRVFAEDSFLFISNKIQSQSTAVDLYRDYVKVVELPVFEMSIWVSDQAPKHDLKCALPRITITTCFDTALALSQLLKYFAEDGDLYPPEDNASATSSGPTSITSEHDLLVDPSDRVACSNPLTTSQMVKVKDLMVEAMEEQPKENTKEKPKSAKTRHRREQVEVFRFPDEVVQNTNDINENQMNDSELINSRLSSGDEKDSSEDEDNEWEKEFTFLDVSSIIPPKCEIRNFVTKPPPIIENFFSTPLERTEPLNPPKHFPSPLNRYTLRDMSLTWLIFGGSDFADPEGKRNMHKNKERKQERAKTDKRDSLTKESFPSVSYSRKAPNEVHLPKIGSRTKRSNLKWIKKGGPGRDEDTQIQINFKKVRYRYEVYCPVTTKYSSRHVLLINEYEILDKMESSKWNKFLYQYSSELEPKKSREMFLFKMLVNRPEAENMPKEVQIKTSMQNLRLYIDQDAFLFLFDFFMSFYKNKNSDGNDSGSSSSRHSTPTHQPPIFSVNLEQKSDELPKETVSNKEPLLIQLDEEKNQMDIETKPRSSSFGETSLQKSTDSSRSTYQAPYYIKNFTFEPEVTIKVDYTGKHVDLSTYGTRTGLLLGLTQLNNSSFKLKQIICRKGILGFDKLISHVIAEWTVHIKENCIPMILQGIGPMHFIVGFVQGFIDLFRMPVQQYLKDGRIVRGLQRGANSFTISTALACVELSVRAIDVVQVTAEFTHGMVSPGPSVRRRMEDRRWRRYNPPSDLREGMTNAYLLMTEGWVDVKDNFYNVASQEHEHKGVPGAVGGVLREIPGTMITPVILLSEGTSNVLGGIRSQLVPDLRKEAFEKYRVENTNTTYHH